MPLTPEDWSVVVVGHWNRAILTPAGIAKQLFGLPSGTPVQVFVPLDTIAPHIVLYGDVKVIPSSDRLIIQPVNNTIDNLKTVMEIAKRALVELPRTPVSAAGINLKYRSTDRVETLEQLTAHSSWDDRLSDADYRIESRAITRSLHWRGGKIQVFITQESEGRYELLLNFETQSNDTDQLQEWVSVATDDIRTQAERVLYNTVSLTHEELSPV
jgi:hypothetical protein